MSKAWLPGPSLGSPLPPGSVRSLPGVHPWLPDPVRPSCGAYNLAWRSPGGPGGAYNLAWHALSRPTPFSFATVNKTKFTSPPGHAMWGGWDHPPFGGSPRPITPCSSPGCIEAPGGRLSDFGGDGRPCQRRGSQIPPARPWALRCPRALSAHSPGSIRGSRTPSARPGAYNLAWRSPGGPGGHTTWHGTPWVDPPPSLSRQ